MAKFHVHIAVIGKGKSPGGATGFRQYLARENRDHASQLQRYIDRENGQPKDELIAQGHAHMPEWAHDNPRAFWLSADRYERANGVVAKVVDVALPRELSLEAQRHLVDDIRTVYFSEHAHSWAIHSPQAKDRSGDQPHMHLMFSPRTNDGIDRSPQQYFSRYNATHPEQGGAQKDRSWDTKGRLQDIRWGVATLTNAALEREGIPAAVSHLSLEAQGFSRNPARYSHPHDRQEVAQVRTYRQRISEGEKQLEHECARVAWSQQKSREHLHSLDRESVREHVSNHVWRYDRSPRREHQRMHSFERSLSRERTPTIQQTPHQTRTPPRDLGRALRELSAALRVRDEAVGGVALRVKLHEEDREHERQERGISW